MSILKTLIESRIYCTTKFQSIMINPSHLIIFALQTYKLAITDLTTAINMDKNSYIAFYNRALCYTKLNELQMVR